MGKCVHVDKPACEVRQVKQLLLSFSFELEGLDEDLTFRRETLILYLLNFKNHNSAEKSLPVTVCVCDSCVSDDCRVICVSHFEHALQRVQRFSVKIICLYLHFKPKLFQLKTYK